MTAPPWDPMLTCLYRNSSDRMVIMRCLGPDGFYLERVIFPFEALCLEAPPTAEVEIWCHALGGAEMLESFTAGLLVVKEAAGEEPQPPLPPIRITNLCRRKRPIRARGLATSNNPTKTASSAPIAI